MTSKYHQSNRSAWNQAAFSYKKNLEDTIHFLRSGKQSLCDVELPFFKNLSSWCHRAIHLQCAGGQDTLSLLNLGAKEVIGVDISDEMIALAKQTSEALSANAQWYRCDIFETPAELNGTADLVYTGKGALNWIHDIEKWAATVARLLKPNGKAYIFEGHPVCYFFDMQGSTFEFDPQFKGYFTTEVYATSSWPESYVGKDLDANQKLAEKYERCWPISQVINALLGAGLTLLRFDEFPDAFWNEFPNMSDAERTKFPNTFSLQFHNNVLNTDRSPR